MSATPVVTDAAGHASTEWTIGQTGLNTLQASVAGLTPVEFSATAVAGLAALLVAQLGHGNPALIRARILESADDLGDPGVDPFYGRGRINVARALGIQP